MSGTGIKTIAIAVLGDLAGALVLAAVVLLARGSGNAPIQIVLPTPAAPASADANTGPRGSPELRVYVSGAVRNPGVYRLDPGDRLEDALTVAGGPTGEADMTRLNLAGGSGTRSTIISSR